MLLLAGNCVPNLCFSQTVTFGSIPEINLNKRLNQVWKVNLGVESRLDHYDSHSQSIQYNTKYNLTDVSFIASRKWKLKYSFNAGYLVRFIENQRVNRFIQQFTIVNRLFKYRFSHRFVTDQTFKSTANITYRLRYRLVLEKALSGLVLDPQEFYIKLGNETLSIYENQLLNVEYRFTPALGYAINDATKLEIGLDTRLKSLFHQSFEWENWFTFNYFFSF